MTVSYDVLDKHKSGNNTSEPHW